MQKHNIIIGVFLCVLFNTLFFKGCIKIETPSDLPHIAYENHVADYCTDELGNENKCLTLNFRLKDGDGNMGLTESDTAPPFTGIYQHNFFYELYVLRNNEFEEWEDLEINYFDIPYIEPEGQNKILVADISIDISFQVSNLTYDTLMLSFYVFDRALNQSNIAVSDTIVFYP